MNEWVWGHRCAHIRLNWSRITSRGWWDKWDDTVLQTHDSKFEPCRYEAGHATSRSRWLPTLLNLYEWPGKKKFVSLKLKGRSGARTRYLRLSKQAAVTTTPGSRHLNEGKSLVDINLSWKFFLTIYTNTASKVPHRIHVDKLHCIYINFCYWKIYMSIIQVVAVCSSPKAKTKPVQTGTCTNQNKTLSLSHSDMYRFYCITLMTGYAKKI